MIDKLKTRYIIIVSLISCIVIIDQVTKFTIKKLMRLYESIEIWGDFFRFTYIENPGMAFGIQMENKILFSLLSVSAAVIVCVYLYRMRNEKIYLPIALSLILGGAIGNLIDRFLYGRVVDFLDVEFFDISVPAFNFLFIEFSGYQLSRWPVFNIADSSVSIGMVIITWMILFVKDNTAEPQVTKVLNDPN